MRLKRDNNSQRAQVQHKKGYHQPENSADQTQLQGIGTAPAHFNWNCTGECMVDYAQGSKMGTSIIIFHYNQHMTLLLRQG